MMDKGKENKAMKEAQTLGYDDVERALLGVAPRGAKENAPGSYEKLMGWAGNGMAKRV